MLVMKQGSPVLLGDHLVAHLAQSINVPDHGQVHWTWFTATTPTEWNAGPPRHPETGALLNQGTLSIDYEQGPIQVLRASIAGPDQANAFGHECFHVTPATPDQQTAQAWVEMCRTADNNLPQNEHSNLAHRIVNSMPEDHKTAIDSHAYWETRRRTADPFKR